MSKGAKKFTTIVKLTSKQYNRRAHASDLELAVVSASGLPSDVKTLHCPRKNGKYIAAEKLYKAFGWYWPTGDCAIDWLEEFNCLMRVRKMCLKEKFRKLED